MHSRNTGAPAYIVDGTCLKSGNSLKDLVIFDLNLSFSDKLENVVKKHIPSFFYPWKQIVQTDVV